MYSDKYCLLYVDEAVFIGMLSIVYLDSEWYKCIINMSIIQWLIIILPYLECDEELKPYQVAKREQEIYSSCCYSNSPWQPVPRNPLAQYRDATYGQGEERVYFLNLRNVYEKVQCRKNKHSKQRVTGAVIDMMVTYCAQIQHIEVYAERLPEAAKLCGDHNGQVPLKPRMDNLMLTDVSKK